MAWNNPTVDDFKAQFPRDFPYNVDPALGVTDTDIAAAYRLTNTQIVGGLFPEQETYSIFYMLLAAHYLVTSLTTSAGGVSGGGFQGLVASKSVGSVSESYSIPQKYLENPLYSFWATTRYGNQYLVYLLQNMTGHVYAVHGSTRP